MMATWLIPAGVAVLGTVLVVWWRSGPRDDEVRA